MTNSILADLKHYIGTVSTYDVFDTDIMMNANGAFFALHQLGAGPPKVFTVFNAEQTWGDFSKDPSLIAAVKQYVYLKVKSIFDPPSTSFVIQSNEKVMEELEWRIREYCDGNVPDNEAEESPPPKPFNPDILTDVEAEGILNLIFGTEDPNAWKWLIATKPEIRDILNLIFGNEDPDHWEELIATKPEIKEVLDKVFGQIGVDTDLCTCRKDVASCPEVQSLLDKIFGCDELEE